MPELFVRRAMRASPSVVWPLVRDVESYPLYMENVRSTRLVGGASEPDRVVAWEVELRGSLLSWTEREHLDEAAGRVDFEQVEGDLEVFRGHWLLQESGALTTVELRVVFEIGIPVLKELLDPVADRALRSNATVMLDSITARAEADSVAGIQR